MKECMENPVRISTLKQEGELKTSRWLKHQVLLDTAEMRALLEHLGSLYMFPVSEPVSMSDTQVSREQFLEKYQEYIDQLRGGVAPDPRIFRKSFSVIWTLTPDVVYAMPVASSRFLIKAIRPVIQLQLHHFFYSRLDHKFHPMVLSSESVSWGLQFSYPQIFQDPVDHSYSRVDSSETFPNTKLFAALAKWLRGHTVPACFYCEGEKTFVPMRIGKECAWAENHPQLKSNQIAIVHTRKVADAH